MEKLTEILLTALFTILGGVIIYCFTRIIETSIIIPIQAFNARLVKSYSKLKFMENLFKNSFAREEINDRFQNLILDSQLSLRESWANLNSSYKNVKKVSFFKKPTEEEIKKIGEGMLYLSNSMLTYTKDEDIDRLEERIKEFDNLIRLLEKYI